MKRIWVFLALAILLVGLIPAALAQGPTPDTEKPVQVPPSEMSITAPNAGIESLSGSFVVFDSSVGGDTCYTPGTAQTFCFRAESFTNDYEYVYNLWQRFPTDWTVNNVYVQGTPACDNGSWGAFSWSFLTSPYEVNITHARYQQPTDHCTAYYCFEVTAGSGTPDALESWYWDGDGYGGVPHWPCSNDGYTPAGQSACDQATQPQAAIPPCTLDPIMLTPAEIHAEGCGYEPQEHTLTVWNNAGYDTNVDLTYTIVAGAGVCGGPAQVFVANGTTLDIIVGFEPHGAPGDTVVCEVYAEDATTPANNDTSSIIKNLVAGFFDPAGWQLEPIAGATGNQWSGGAVGTNPAAAGPVGYVVGGLGVGSSVPNPDLQMYDPGTGTWTQLADMPNVRFSPVTGFIGGLLYAAGGYDAAFGATADLQVYDPVAGTWDNTTPAELPAIRGGGAGGVGLCSSGTGPCLFHVGGGLDSSFANTTLTTYQYDPGTNAWTQLDNKPAGSSPDGHILGAGVGCLGKVYVGGDYRGFHDFFALDATQPAGSQWTTLASIPGAAGAMTPAFVCKEDWGAIVLIGGDPDGGWGTYNTTVYVYDIATDTWSDALPQTLHVGQLGSVGWHMDGKVWTAGGTIGSGAISPMPFESLLQFICEPPGGFNAWKEAPAQAMSGERITYEITLQAPVLDVGAYMNDPLPMGVEYAGNLTFTDGVAWYSPTANTVYWLIPPPAAAGTPAPARPTFYYPNAVADLAGAAEPPAPDAAAGPTWAYPEAVLWDNGPLVTDPGACAGMDASRLQTGLGMNTLGFGHQADLGYRMADDFEITDPAGWQIDSVTFFAYQTGAPVSPSPITAVYYQIWDGPPNDPGSTVVWGDLTTNRLVSTASPNMQRDSGTSPCANNRYIFADVASAGVVLPPGVYWLDWMTDGNLTSGPWAPPVTIVGQTTTGNGLQYTTAWAAANDSGTLTQQGLPFVIEGTILGAGEEVYISFDVTVTAYCGEFILNEAIASDGTDVVLFDAETEVLGECDIEVTPEALFADLCPDTTTELPLLICNVGTCDLEWEIHEMTPTLVLAPAPIAPRTPYTGRPVVLSTASPEAVSVETNPPTIDAPVTLILDDGSRDNDIGLGGTIEILWVNRFTPAPGEFPFVLNQVQIYFSTVGLVNVGDDIVIIVYENTTGNNDPAVGANWLYSYPTTVQALDTWNIYNLPAPVAFNGPGDVIIGVIGMETPGTSYWPASMDQTATQQRSWAGWWNASPPPDPPILPPENWTLIDVYFPGNWMVRGYGETGGGIVYPDFPWVSETPITGTVFPGECQTVTVTFDATGLTPGDYFADLVILSNDPDEPEIVVPTTMTVWDGAEILTVTTAITDLTVAFTADVAGPEPITYLWDFGDGVGASTETNPVYTYAEGGCYTVTLEVDSFCGGDIWTGEVCVVAPCDPVHDADFTWMPMMPIVDEVVYFTATAAGTGPITYEWDLGDGTMDTGEFVNHAYAAEGTYTVIMTATGECGFDVATYDVVVASGCVAPSGVDFTWAPLSPAVGQSTQFTGVVGGGTAPLFYTWDFGDGSGATGSLTPAYMYATAGTFTVTLTVTNTCGMDDIAYAITVTPAVEGYAVYLPIIVRP